MRLQLSFIFSVGFLWAAIAGVAQPVWADAEIGDRCHKSNVSCDRSVSAATGEEQALNSPSFSSPTPLRLSQLDLPATTLADWQTQIDRASDPQLSQASPPTSDAPVPITAVQLNSTDTELQVILETPEGQLPIPSPSVVGNALIADIPNAVLALPDGNEFQAASPVEGITLVNVTELPGNRVRVAITGSDAPPMAEIRTEAIGLVLGITTGIANGSAPEEESIQIVVTGDQVEGYSVPEASVGTRTDTPILRVPQSIQVIPEQVLEEQDPLTVAETLRNAPGISTGRVSSDNLGVSAVIRGFESNNILRNGLRDETARRISGVTNIDRVEILRGPASVLYGQGNLGGTINLVTEQPLDEPLYQLEYTVGQYGLHRPAIDIGGPFGADSPLAYRFNATYESSNSFREFEESEYWFVAPSVRLINTENTSLIADLEYLDFASNGGAPELPAVGTVIENPNGDVEIDENLGEPAFTEDEQTITRIGYRLEHRFNEDWLIRNEFLGAFRETPESTGIIPLELQEDNRTLNRVFLENPSEQSNYTLNTNLIGNFETGSIEHELLVGVELFRAVEDDTINLRSIDPIDIFDPDYTPESLGDLLIPNADTRTETNNVGIYLQDQISLLDNLILVLGGRFDIVNQSYEDFLNAEEGFDRDDTAFSPRIGIVYLPTEDISLYASYTESFVPVIGRERTFDSDTNESVPGDPFEPERGRQYEVGVKADLFDDRLSATLALYQLERSNVTTPDPDNPAAQVQVGEQRSRGVELIVVGEILPGWNLIGGYAYTNAEITEDNQFEEGNQLNNVPEHAASLWTTYEIQRGDLAGLGFGLGFFFQGDREGDLENTFELPSFVRTDAALFYRRDRLRLALNVQNLFDLEYFEGARNDVRVIPGAPFTISGQVSWEF